MVKVIVDVLKKPILPTIYAFLKVYIPQPLNVYKTTAVDCCLHHDYFKTVNQYPSFYVNGSIVSEMVYLYKSVVTQYLCFGMF